MGSTSVMRHSAYCLGLLRSVDQSKYSLWVSVGPTCCELLRQRKRMKHLRSALVSLF